MPVFEDGQTGDLHVARAIAAMHLIQAHHQARHLRHMSNYKYGIVIDSGSLGSRVQVYRWQDVSLLSASRDPEILSSPPAISHEDGWSLKISPGVSNFAHKPGKVWLDHYAKLLAFAESVVPAYRVHDTPVYVLSTAGMRLLAESDRAAILAETCKALKKNTRFQINDCQDHVQVIDGFTEGMYGWLALNYLMGLFSNYLPADPHTSVGFMDMGGASTQIAFVPAPGEVTRHDEDIATVVLRNINGKAQLWRVFVETWLGFGANQSRSRYLQNLIGLSAALNPRARVKTVTDPCMPKGAVLSNFEYGSRSYEIQGTGNYESCLRGIYPLLMKHLPCSDEPCLFNGVHAPQMNFENDKFVGVSEYWYTANDIFHSGGEYNFHSFNEKVKSFCDSTWEEVQSKSKDGEYSDLPEAFLLDACFKASWVINVLHEGFGLPRLDVDIVDEGKSSEVKEVEKVNVPFKSANSVDGKELLWTLGKILLVASSQIEPRDNTPVGVTASAMALKFADNDTDYDSDDESGGASKSAFSILLIFILGLLIYRYGRSALLGIVTRFTKSNGRLPPKMRDGISFIRSRTPRFFNPHLSRFISYIELQERELEDANLEAGNAKTPPQPLGPSVLRTRSTINFESETGPDTIDFLHKPFVTPKTATTLYSHRSDSLDSLHKLSSSSSIARGKK